MERFRKVKIISWSSKKTAIYYYFEMKHQLPNNHN
jgi:hypothetical protein